MSRRRSGIALMRTLSSAVLSVSSVFGMLSSGEAWASTPHAQRPTAPSSTAFEVWGYQAWWMGENWPSVDLGLWRRAIFFEIPVHADGHVGNTPVPASRLAEMAGDAVRCGSQLDIAFTLFDESIFEQIFTSERKRQNLVSEIAGLTARSNAHGVHLDFEIYKAVSPTAVAGFRSFVAQLKAQLRSDGAQRMLSLFGPVGAAQDLVDKKTLGILDFVVVQGYDAHWVAGPVAGSVAPLKGRHALSWEKSLRHYLQLGAQRSRLLFSIPYFGYEWPTATSEPGSKTTGRGLEITYAPVTPQWIPKISLSAVGQAQQHGMLRDAETGSPYYAYRDAEGKWRQGWFEDEISLAEKFAFVRHEKLAGVAAFPIGYDRGAFDAVVGRSFGRRPQCTPTGG